MKLLLTGFLLVSARMLVVTNAVQIEKLKLINAQTNTPLLDLENGAVINISDFGMTVPSFNIQALTLPATVGSVRFGYNGTSYSIESSAPYAFCRDKGGIFNSCPVLKLGSHAVSATAISLTGEAGVPAQVTFTLVEGVAPTPPVAPPVAAPVAAPVATPMAAPVATPIRVPPISSPVVVSPVALPTSPQPPQPVSAAIPEIQLIYSPTNKNVMNLYDGAIVSLADLGLPQAAFNVNAVPAANILSVKFKETNRMESQKPFSFCGDANGIFATCATLVVGSTNKVTVTPYTGSKGTGTALPDVSITFTIQYASIKPPAPGSVPVAVPLPIAPPISLPQPVTNAPVRVPVSLPAPTVFPIDLPSINNAVAAAKTDIKAIFTAEMGAKFIRLAFHDCIGGCNGCVDTSNHENFGLDVPMDALAPIVTKYQSVLSRADIWVLAAFTAAEEMQPKYSGSIIFVNPVKFVPFNMTFVGRPVCDGPANRGPFVQMPNPHVYTEQLMQFFAANFDFSERETVAIMGAHTVGIATKSNSGFDGPDGWVGSSDTLNNNFYTKLVMGEDVSEAFRLIPQFNTGTVFPNQFLWRIGSSKEFMLNADMAIVINLDGKVDPISGNVTCRVVGLGEICPTSSTLPIVVEYANNAQTWINDFRNAFLKMTSKGCQATTCIQIL